MTFELYSEGESGSKHHVNDVAGRRYRIASFYLQRHSRDVLNQALPPLFDGGSKVIRKICARKRESLGTRLYLYGYAGRMERWAALACTSQEVVEKMHYCVVYKLRG